MHLPRDAMLLRIFVSESDHAATNRSKKPLCSRREKCAWRAQWGCAGRGVLAKRAGCTRLKFSGLDWACRSDEENAIGAEQPKS